MPPVPRPKSRAPKQGPNRTLILAAAAAAAVALAVIVGALVLTGGDDGDGGSSTPGTSLFTGMAQENTFLGSPDAKVTLIEYADLQCPVCRQYAEDGLPGIVEEYVKTGKVRLEFRGLAFIGEDSERALRFALAAGLQDRLWQVQEALYDNQGEENAGWVTDDLVRSLGEGIAGLDVDRMFADTDAKAVEDELAESRSQAQQAEVPGTPWFFVQIGDEEPYNIQPSSLATEGFREALDGALAEAG